MLPSSQPLPSVPDQPVDYQAAFEALPGSFLLLAPNAPAYTVLAISTDLLELTARTRQQVIGQSVFTVYPENPDAPTATGPSALRASLQNAAHTQQSDQMPVVRYDLRNAAGVFEPRYWSSLTKPLLDAAGQVQYLLHTTQDITEQVRKQDQQRELSKIEKTYGLFLQAPVAVCILTGPEYTIELANDEMHRFWGTTPAVTGQPLFAALPHAREHGFAELLDQVRKTGESYFGTEYPVQFAGPEQPVQYYNFIYQAYFENPTDATAAGVFCVAHNVTAQVIARQQVEESERQVRALVDSAPFPISVHVGQDLRIQSANQAMLTAWGKGPAVLGRAFAEVLPEFEDQDVFFQMEQVFATGQPFGVRNQQIEVVIGGAPQTFYYHYNFTPLYNPDGSVYGIVNTGADVTDLMLARQRIEKYAAELEESEERFRIMADAAPNHVWAVHPDSSIRYVNRAFLEFVGVSLEEYLRVGWASYLYPEELEHAQHILTEAISGQTIYRLEHRMRRHDGQYRWLLAQGAPSYYPNGELYGYVGSAIDITELKQMNEQLVQTNNDLDNFVYTASHDLKAPIHNIEGLLHALLQTLPPETRHSGQVQRLTDMMQESVDRFTKTIANLTDVVKLQKENSEEAVLVELASVLQDVCLDLEPLRAAAAGQLQSRVPGGCLFGSRPKTCVLCCITC
ncbi:PAS domain-containing protein [Hymenobacter sp. 5516J-16]|uniref:PAS domain-containing protein n=1 Tax=Hymenobacter sp. 5516J-16 TaxID=2932253 RepID=UPI001FD22372|nr:PAS domain-containing protein [Hymenobacter sp. 5516J-16]UOQ76987.1 PAS domain-containing protein [Hymenobacter sp. 5516J-16]